MDSPSKSNLLPIHLSCSTALSNDPTLNDANSLKNNSTDKTAFEHADNTDKVEKATDTTKVKNSQKQCNQSDCKRRLVLSDMPCRCGLRFCMSHKYDKEHSCTFDYRAESLGLLKKQLVKCDGDRLPEKI